jgi:hypothetical protein
MCNYCVTSLFYHGFRITINVATLALGLRPKQGLVRLRVKKKLKSEGKCEGMNFHTPKRAFILGVWNPVDFQIFKKRLQRSKFNELKSSLYY